MTTLIADLETDGLLPDLTRVWQISLIDTDTGEEASYNRGTIHEGLRRMLSSGALVMHNGIGFDLPAITKVYGDQYPVHWAKVRDTMVLSKLGNPERPGGHSLEAWGHRVGEGFDKVQHDDWSQWSPEMEHRCLMDTRLTWEVYKRLRGMYEAMPEAVSIEHAVAWEVRKTVHRGFALDVPYTQGLLGELMTEREKELEGFQEMFPPILVPPHRTKPIKCLKNVNKIHPLRGKLDANTEFCPVVVEEFNPASRQQIAQRLITKYGWKPKQYTPSGAPEINEDTLRELPYEEASAFADYLIVDKKIGQLNSTPKSNGHGGGWLQHVTPTGKVHASLDSLRAVTGRLACSSPNVQQADKDPRMRKCWVPSKGRVLVGNDAEGLELRCLSHYLWPLDGGAYAKMLLEGQKSDGTDVHSVVMRLIGFYDRDNTKRAEYGWLYGAGDPKLGMIAFQDAYSVGKEINYAHLGLSTAKKRPSLSKVGKAIRARLLEGITGLKDLSEGIKEKAKSEGKLKGLDGRTLWVRSEHSALNLLLQSAGIIVVKKAWTLMNAALLEHGLLEDQDYGVVMQVHDEFQIEARPEIADVVGQVVSKCIVQAGKDLRFRCPLAGDYKIGHSWAETH